MVQAVIKDGRVELLDPLPAEWSAGTRLNVDRLSVDEDTNSSAYREFVDQWAAEFEAMFDGVDPVQEESDHALLEANLAEADRIAKEFVRRDMGL